MTLREYILSFPRKERRHVRTRIGKRLNVTEQCIRHYANGTRNIPSSKLQPLREACEERVSIEEMLEEVEEA